MADALQFQLNLVDKMTAPAKAASRSLGALEAQLKAESASVRQLQAAMRNLQAGTSVNIDEFRKLQSQLTGKKDLVAGLQSQILALGGASKKTGFSLRAIWDSALWRKEIDIVELAKLGVSAITTVAEMAGKAARDLAEGAFSIAKFAVGAAEAKNDTIDMLDAMLGSQTAARDTYSQIEDLTNQVAISQDRALDLARGLTASGISNSARLTASIRSIGEVDQVLKGGGEKVQKLIERATTAGKFDINAKRLTGTGIQIKALYAQIAKQTGVGVKQVEAQLKAGKISAEQGIDALNAVVQQRFGGVVAKQMLNVTNQITRLKSNFGKLFEDVNTDKFLGALDSVLSLFDQSTVAGSALHDIITDTFSSLFDTASDVVPYVKTLFKGLVIIGLQMVIGVKDLIREFKRLGGASFDIDNLSKSMSQAGKQSRAALDSIDVGTLKQSWDVMKSIPGALSEVASAFKEVGLAAWEIPKSFWIVGQNILSVLKWIGEGLGDGVYWMVQIIKDDWSKLAGWWTSAGSNIVDGLIDGIKNGGARLVASVTGLAGDALAAFKKTFGIHSPSRVMMGMGRNLQLGLVAGLDQEAPRSHEAMGSMVSAVAPPRVRGQSGNSRGGTTVVMQPGAVNISGTNPQEMKDLFPEVMADVFEQAGIMTGASSAPQAT
jgi:hypothetical protein